MHAFAHRAFVSIFSVLSIQLRPKNGGAGSCMWRRSKQEWRCWRPRLRFPLLLYSTAVTGCSALHYSWSQQRSVRCFAVQLIELSNRLRPATAMGRCSKPEWRCWRPRLRFPRLFYCCDGVQYAPLLGANSGALGVSPFSSTSCRPDPSASRRKQMIHSLIGRCRVSPSGGIATTILRRRLRSNVSRRQTLRAGTQGLRRVDNELL